MHEGGDKRKNQWKGKSSKKDNAKKIEKGIRIKKMCQNDKAKKKKNCNKNKEKILWESFNLKKKNKKIIMMYEKPTKYQKVMW